MNDTSLILVVDDQPQNIELLEAFLVPQGYVIIQARNGPEALAMLSENNIDLILLDIIMPGMDGFEVTRRVRQDPKNQQLPIILVTALRETEDRVKGIEAGCDDFISKPVDKTELVARVRSLLKVKAFNDLTNSYQKKIEAEVIKRTIELHQTTISLQQEVAERKLAEKKIEADRKHLIITLRSIGDGVITTDSKGAVVTINKSAEFLTGWESEKALGRPIAEIVILVNELTRKSCDNPVEIALRTNTDVEFNHDVYMIAKDSSERLVTINVSMLNDSEDNAIGCVLFFRDITQKQKLNDSLQRAQKLESLGVLAGGIAHDFNNLLSGIFGYIEIAKTCIIDKKTDKGIDFIVKALGVFGRAKSLTQQLLTFSKGGSPKCSTMQLKPLIKKNARFILSGSNVLYQFDIPDSLWLCDIDENQFGQVIDNIVINAKQSMPMGGTIVLSAENITITPADKIVPNQQDKFVCISIQDTGMGIPKELLGNIFDPFFSTKQTGHGLGLATVHSIVQRHNGWIDVKSTCGKGTTFQIFLPASQHGALNTVKTISIPHSGSGTIVVMDDENYIREILTEMLSSMGYLVKTTANSQETLSFFENASTLKKPVRAAILDLTIPGGEGGKETLVKLLKIDPNIKAIALSGYSNDPIMVQPSDYGFIDKLSKPYTKQDVADVLSRVLMHA